MERSGGKFAAEAAVDKGAKAYRWLYAVAPGVHAEGE